MCVYSCADAHVHEAVSRVHMLLSLISITETGTHCQTIYIIIYGARTV
jgi:hypothetical protein